MANFTRVKPAGWGFKAKLESALLNALDIDHTKAVNGDDGSTHDGNVTLGSLVLNRDLTARKGTFTQTVANTAGVVSTGNGTGAGGTFTGGATNAPGIVATGGGAGLGVDCNGGLDVSGNAIIGGTLQVVGNTTLEGTLEVDDGLVVTAGISLDTHITFATSGPAANADPGANRAHALSQSKVLGHIRTTGGAVSVIDGMNIASVAIDGNWVKITFARAFSTKDYIPTLTKMNALSGIIVADYDESTASMLAVLHFSDSGGSVAPGLSDLRFSVDIKGRH